eukprot:753183-Prymnesium_polylepis.2
MLAPMTMRSTPSTETAAAKGRQHCTDGKGLDDCAGALSAGCGILPVHGLMSACFDSRWQTTFT